MRKTTLALLAALSTNTALAAPNYVITKDEQMRNIKRSVEVELTERATEQELKEIAEDLYESGFKNTFNGYRLTGENQGAYWATTHFTPKLDVKIVGSTAEEHQALNNLDTQVSAKDAIGSWRANWGFEYKIIFNNKGDDLIVKSIFADGSNNEELLIVEKTSDQVRYYTESDKENNEFYIINENGNLEFWSENGNYYTAPKENTK